MLAGGIKHWKSKRKILLVMTKKKNDKRKERKRSTADEIKFKAGEHVYQIVVCPQFDR